VGEAGVEGERRWKLDEQWAEFGDGTGVQATGLIEEGLEQRTAVGQLCGVGDRFWNFDGEAEVVGGGSGPALPGFAQVGAVEAGIDLGAAQDGGVALEVSSCGGKVVRVLRREGPASGADVEGHA
jgi:hypothetical protein